MTEKEFAALLALEGCRLAVKEAYFRTDRSPYEVVRHVNAVVYDSEGCVVCNSGYVRRRWYAVQSLIKRYYP